METCNDIFKNFKKYICIILITIFIICVIYFFSKYFIIVGDTLNKYSAGILALTAILGLIFGQSWLDTSKQKMKGKLDYDIARKYLKSVFEIRDAIKALRNPFVSTGEIQEALVKSGFKIEDYENTIKRDSSVYSLRWNNIQIAWTNFEKVLLESEVSWGNESISIQNDLDQLVRKLRSNVWLFVNYRESFNKDWINNSKILYGAHDENDEFAQDINSEIEKIKNFLKKHL